MGTTLLERLQAATFTDESLDGLVPLVQNSDPNFPTINDSFEKGTYDETLRSDTSNPDSVAAGRITRLPKRP
jgi:hypothetical protein